MHFYRTLLDQETGLWPLQIESKQTLFYVPWTVKDRTHGQALTHWGRVKHICVSKLTTIGSDNGLSPGRRQAIIWSNAGILLNWTLGTNFLEILSEIDTFSFKQMRLKMSSGKWRPYCLGLNVLRSGFAIVALVVHRAQKSVPDSAGEWPTFLPPPLESCSGTANADGPNSVFTRGQFWSLGIVVACVCLCMHLSVRFRFMNAYFFHQRNYMIASGEAWFVHKSRENTYRQFSNISRAQSQSINVSRLVLQLSLPNPLKPGVELRMKM